MPETINAERQSLVKRGWRLEHFTILWNCIGAVAALITGWVAGSVALVGFGFDSLIEVMSGAAMLWRLHHDRNAKMREKAEHVTLRVMGVCFLLLSACITWDSSDELFAGRAPEKSIPGLVVAVASLIAMPLLSAPSTASA